MGAYAPGVTPLTIDEFVDGWFHANFAIDYPQWLYELYAPIPGIDPEEAVAFVYAGVTQNLSRRLHQHARKWWWTAVDLRLSQALGYNSRAEVLQAESETIRLYRPQMNRAGRLLVVTSV